MMAGARSDASAAGLFVVGDVIEEPSSGDRAFAYKFALDTADAARTVDTLYDDGLGSFRDAAGDGLDALYDTGASVGDLATGAWDALF